MIIDIGDRVTAENNLRESEDRYKELINNINDVVYSTDFTGKFTYVSPIIKNISGYDESEVLGKNFSSFVYWKDLPSLLLRFKDILTTDRLKPAKFRIVKKDGEALWVQTSSRPIVKEGRAVGIRGIISDIDNRKKQNWNCLIKKKSLKK